MKKKAKSTANIIDNRRARFDYALSDEFSVGIVLTGPEVKAARNNRVTLKGSYVNVKDGELWLTNASFSVIHTEPGKSTTAVDTRPRKLLAKKREIAQIIAAKNQGSTVVPLSMSTKTNFIKLKIAIGKGKKQYDKRQTIKKRDTERENKRVLRSLG
ncbi:MAG TPA: SsrA-binding protein SmpB [Candidatus Saccharimonadales bacterium]|nr:SsrA-binding protein SmpB [Candidatus Saccharimonadales bacterium]